MNRLAAIVALVFTCLAPQAYAQTELMTELDFGKLRETVEDLQFTLNDEGVDEDGDYYLEVESDTGLAFYLYGASCDENDPALNCLGLNMVATFSLGAEADTQAVMDSLSYAFMKVYRSGDDIKIARYLIFDEGITRGNMQANVSIFAEIGDLIWGKLTDAGVLEN